MLKNKADIWKSVDPWIFKPKDQDNDLIYIENNSSLSVSNSIVLGATVDDVVTQEFLVEGNANQLWKKGKLDADGYFTLENSGGQRILTAISENDLEIKGNITMR